MAQADNIYIKEFGRHFTNHIANYPATRPISLGDFGIMSRGTFTRLGNIEREYSIDFLTLPDNEPTNEQFQSTGSTNITFFAKGDVKPGGIPLAKAQVEIEFTSEKSFFFSAAEVRDLQIDNLYEVGKKIIALYNQGKWEKRFVLISSLLVTNHAVIIVSGKSNAKTTIEAESDQIPKIDLFDSSLKLGFSNSTGLDYKIIADKVTQIGFTTSRIYNPLFNKPVFKNKQNLSDLFAQIDADKNIDSSGLAFGNTINVTDITQDSGIA